MSDTLSKVFFPTTKFVVRLKDVKEYEYDGKGYAISCPLRFYSTHENKQLQSKVTKLNEKLTGRLVIDYKYAIPGYDRGSENCFPLIEGNSDSLAHYCLIAFYIIDNLLGASTSDKYAAWFFSGNIFGNNFDAWNSINPIENINKKISRIIFETSYNRNVANALKADVDGRTVRILFCYKDYFQSDTDLSINEQSGKDVACIEQIQKELKQVAEERSPAFRCIDLKTGEGVASGIIPDHARMIYAREEDPRQEMHLDLIRVAAFDEIIGLVYGKTIDAIAGEIRKKGDRGTVAVRKRRLKFIAASCAALSVLAGGLFASRAARTAQIRASFNDAVASKQYEEAFDRLAELASYGETVGAATLNEVMSRLPWEILSLEFGPYTGDAVSAVAFSHDDRHLAFARGDGTIEIIGLRDGTRNKIQTGFTGHRTVCGIAFTPDDRFIVTLHWYGDLHLLDAQTGKERRILPFLSVRERHLHNGNACRVTGYEDGKIVTDTGGRFAPQPITHPREVVMSPSSRYLAVVSIQPPFAPSVDVWDVTAARSAASIRPCAGAAPTALAFRGEYRVMVACGDGAVEEWSVPNATFLGRKGGGTEDARFASGAISISACRAAIARKDGDRASGKVELRDLEGRMVKFITATTGPGGIDVRFTRNGLLAVAGSEKTFLFNAQDGSPVNVIQGGQYFSPGGSYAYSYSRRSRDLRVIDTSPDLDEGWLNRAGTKSGPIIKSARDFRTGGDPLKRYRGVALNVYPFFSMGGSLYAPIFALNAFMELEKSIGSDLRENRITVALERERTLKRFTEEPFWKSAARMGPDSDHSVLLMDLFIKAAKQTGDARYNKMAFDAALGDRRSLPKIQKDHVTRCIRKLFENGSASLAAAWFGEAGLHDPAIEGWLRLFGGDPRGAVESFRSAAGDEAGFATALAMLAAGDGEGGVNLYRSLLPSSSPEGIRGSIRDLEYALKFRDRFPLRHEALRPEYLPSSLNYCLGLHYAELYRRHKAELDVSSLKDAEEKAVASLNRSRDGRTYNGERFDCRELFGRRALEIMLAAMGMKDFFNAARTCGGLRARIEGDARLLQRLEKDGLLDGVYDAAEIYCRCHGGITKRWYDDAAVVRSKITTRWR